MRGSESGALTAQFRLLDRSARVLPKAVKSGPVAGKISQFLAIVGNLFCLARKYQAAPSGAAGELLWPSAPALLEAIGILEVGPMW